jgi:hypothetical protein
MDILLETKLHEPTRGDGGVERPALVQAEDILEDIEADVAPDGEEDRQLSIGEPVADEVVDRGIGGGPRGRISLETLDEGAEGVDEANGIL